MATTEDVLRLMGATKVAKDQAERKAKEEVQHAENAAWGMHKNITLWVHPLRQQGLRYTEGQTKGVVDTPAGRVSFNEALLDIKFEDRSCVIKAIVEDHGGLKAAIIIEGADEFRAVEDPEQIHPGWHYSLPGEPSNWFVFNQNTFYDLLIKALKIEQYEDDQH